MKLLYSTLIASVALLTQPLQAVTSNINESIREYQAILDASATLETVIPQSEFIFEIQRRTKDINATIVNYIVITVTNPEENADGLSLDQSYSKSHYHFHQYQVQLELTVNPVIGPPVITVLSVKQLD